MQQSPSLRGCASTTCACAVRRSQLARADQPDCWRLLPGSRDLRPRGAGAVSAALRRLPPQSAQLHTCALPISITRSASTQELLNLGTRAMRSLARGAPAQELFSRSIARPKSSRSAVCASELSGRLKCGRWAVSSPAAMAHQQGKVGRGRSQRSLFAARVLAVDGAAPSTRTSTPPLALAHVSGPNCRRSGQCGGCSECSG